VLHFEHIKQRTVVRVFTQENTLLMCLSSIQEPFSVHHKGRNVPYFVSKKIVANGRVCVRGGGGANERARVFVLCVCLCVFVCEHTQHKLH
jgi:hypothetical protein